jgi:hypothetical protein
VSWAGFQITGQPHTRAGKIFQDGTAIGKFQGVTIPNTPPGRRIVNPILSRSSDGAVRPNSRRPSLAA